MPWYTNSVRKHCRFFSLSEYSPLKIFGRDENLYLLTPWCRVLLEKLTGLQLVKKFPAFHGTWRFITALTSVRHLSLSWARPIQSIYQHPTSWRFILILSTHLRLGLPSVYKKNKRNQKRSFFYCYFCLKERKWSFHHKEGKRVPNIRHFNPKNRNLNIDPRQKGTSDTTHFCV